MLYEPVSVRASVAILSTPTTCSREGRTTSAAFSAAHEMHLADVTEGAGREQPPGFAALAVPRPTRGVAHALVPVSQTAIKRREICAPIASALFVEYLSQIAHGTNRTFDADLGFRTRLCRPSHDQRRAVLDLVKALAALDPAGFGLGNACAQLEGSTYVMAEEACRIIRIDRTSATGIS